MQSGSPLHPIFVVHLRLNGFGTPLDGSPLTLAPLLKREEYYISNPSIIFFHFVFLLFYFLFLLNLSRFLTSQKNGSGIIVAIKSVPRWQGSTHEKGTQPHQERRGITLSSSPLLFLIYFPSLKFQFKVYWSWEKRMKKGELDEGMYLLSWCVEA